MTTQRPMPPAQGPSGTQGGADNLVDPDQTAFLPPVARVLPPPVAEDARPAWRVRSTPKAPSWVGRLGGWDQVRFAVGTLTRVRVPAPAHVDAGVAGGGLVLAPLVGLALALVSGLPLVLGAPDLLNRILTAVLTVGLAAWLTRGLHWDGLADLADGLGSGRPAARALEIMRASDIGPFGTLALLFAVLLQALGLAVLPSGSPALAGWVVAQTGARMALVIGCGRWVRPARPDGLGALVVGQVSVPRVGAAVGLAAAISLAAVTLGGLPVAAGLLGLVAAALVALVVARVARQRLGGSTGDVLGATVEIAVTATLLVIAYFH